jgi:mono/diheme cytochrome c family protein
MFAMSCLAAAGMTAVLAAAPAVQSSAPVSRDRAIELYSANCQVCHGPSGTGSPLTQGSAFAGRKWKHGNRPEDVVKTITNGVPGTMMLPFKDRLSRAEITALAALVRSYDKALKPAGVKKSGRASVARP